MAPALIEETKQKAAYIEIPVQNQAAESTETTEVSRFQVTDRGSLNYVIRRIKDARRRAADADAWREREVREAQEEEARQLREHEAAMQNVLRDELEQQKGKARSLNLPAGRAGFRSQSAQLVVKDPGQLLEWARDHYPDSIHRSLEIALDGVPDDVVASIQALLSPYMEKPSVIETVSKSRINDYYKQTKLLPDGCEIKPAQDVFYIE